MPADRDQVLGALMNLAARCFSRFEDLPQWKLREAIDAALLDAYQRGVRDAVDRMLAAEADDQQEAGP